MVPLRQELNRVKEQCNKERMGRLAAQQEVNMLKEQLQRLEGINENLDRESKTVPALTESNEILKNDLNQLRRKAREEKSGLQKHIKKLEAQVKEADTLKAIVREISLKLLDVTNNGVAGKSGAANTYGGVSAGIASPAHSTGSNYSHNMRYSSSVPTIPQQANGATNIYYQQQHTGYNAYLHAGDDDEEEDEEDSEDEEEDDDDYDDRSYISVGTIDSHIDCVDSKGHTGSAPSRNDPRPPHTMNHPIQHHQGHSGSNLISGSVESSHQSSSAKKNSMGKNAQTTARKKKSVVRKGAGASVKRSAGGQMNMMHVIQDGGQQQNLTLPRI